MKNKLPILTKFVIILITLVVGLQVNGGIVYAASNWKTNPNTCPKKDDTNFPGQSCPGALKICGDDGGNAQCYQTSTLNPPSSNSSPSNTQYGSITSGGYVVDCYAVVDASQPYCDNSGGFWCNRDPECVGWHRDTICMEDTFAQNPNSYKCNDSCHTGYHDCNDDDESCEIHDGDSCGISSHGTHLGCSGSSGNCTCRYDSVSGTGTSGSSSNYFDCNSSGASVGNGCESEYHGTSSCGGHAWITHCASSNAVCGCQSGNIDFDNNDGDTNIDTGGSGNGCEIITGEACTMTVGGIAGTCAGNNSADTGTADSDGDHCNCVGEKSYFETGTLSSYSTSDPLLWGRQFGSGDLIHFGNSSNADLFVVNNDGSVSVAQITAPSTTTDKLYNVGGNLYWNGALIGAASGGDSIWDTDGDTGIQVEESADEDIIRFDTAGNERMVIYNDGRLAVGQIDARATRAFNILGGDSWGAAATLLIDGDDGTGDGYDAHLILNGDAIGGGDSSIYFNTNGNNVGSITAAMPSSGLQITATRLLLSATDFDVYAPEHGIEYAADYSSVYTIRSLVDKAYVDSKVGTSLWDADGDTGIQVEESADEDIIRFDTGGTERFVMNGYNAYWGTEGENYFNIVSDGISGDPGYLQFMELDHTILKQIGSGGDTSDLEIATLNNTGISFHTNGLRRARFDSSGRMGIGEANSTIPIVAGSALTLYRDGGHSILSVMSEPGSGDVGLSLYEDTTRVATLYHDAGDLKLLNLTPNSLRLGNSGNTQMIINSSGNVGVGIDSESLTARLEITPSTTNALRIHPYGTSAGNTGAMQYMELVANGTNYVGFKSPDSITTNVTWILPNADGTSGQALQTNGSGVLSWSAISTGGGWTDDGSTVRLTEVLDSVGIGTNSVNAKLQIEANNSSSDANLLRFQASNNDDIQSKIYFPSGGNATSWDVNSSGNGGALIFYDDGTEIAKILNNGLIVNEGGIANVDFRVESDSDTHMLFVDSSDNHVGIGVSIPMYDLSVENDIGLEGTRIAYVNVNDLIFGDTDGGGFDIVINSDNEYIAFDVVGSEKMRIDTSGSVAIGTTSFEDRLHVAGGNINIDKTYGIAFDSTSLGRIFLDDGTSQANNDLLIAADLGGSSAIHFVATDDPSSSYFSVSPSEIVALAGGVMRVGANSGSLGGSIRFNEGNTGGLNYVGFMAPATVASNVVWVLPNADGSENQVLTTDGAGNLSWSTGGSSSPWGSSGGRIYPAHGGDDIDLGSAETLKLGSVDVGQVMFSGTDRIVSGENNLFWDNANDRLGIGTSTPAQMLDVNGTIASEGQSVVRYNAGDLVAYFGDLDATGTSIDFRAGNGTASTVMRIETGGDIGIGTGLGAINAKLDVRGSAIFNDASGDYDFRIESDTNANMFFVDGGNDRVGIGTASPATILEIEDTAPVLTIDSSTDNDAGINLAENGSVKWNTYNDGDNSDRFYITDEDNDNGVYLAQDATSWTANSDIRLKENVITIDNALDSILNMRGVKYNFIGTDNTEIGVIAQETEKYFPEIVDTNGEYWGVTYSRIGPILIEAIKEQQAEIDNLGDQELMTEALKTQLTEEVWQRIEEKHLANLELANQELREELSLMANWNNAIWTFIEKVVFEKAVNFLAEVTFGKKVTFEDHVVFSRDMAGQIIIKSGEDQSKVEFDGDYKTTPVVTLTITNNIKSNYWVSDTSTNGFRVNIDPVLSQDIVINWVAVWTTNSSLAPEPTDQTLSESSPSIIPTPTSEPTTSIEPSPSTEQTPKEFSELNSNLAPISTPDPSLEPNLNKIKVLPNELDFVRLRESYTTDSDELAQIPVGTELKFTRISYGWYEVSYEEMTGWISETMVMEI